MPRPQPLCGQVGSVFLLSEAVEAEHVHQIWSLGSSFDWVADRDEATVDSQPVMTSLIMALNPQSRDGEHFPNNAALVGGDATVPSLATLCAGSRACVTHTMRDSAHCLGGVQLLFPQLARLPGTQSDSPGSLRGEQLLVQLLGLMSQMLWDSAADQHFMLRRNGFAIFVFLLRQLPPVLWTVQAVTACEQLTSCFASSEALHHEAICLLFGAPRLWIFTQFEVQCEVYEVLQAVVERKPAAFLAPAGGGGEPLLSVQALLDMLEIYYWRQASAVSFARHPLRHAVSGEVIGERPSLDCLRKLRKRVLRLLQVGTALRPLPPYYIPTGRHSPSPPSSLHSCRQAQPLPSSLPTFLQAGTAPLPPPTLHSYR